MSHGLARWVAFVAVVAGIAGLYAASPSAAQDAPARGKDPLLPADADDVSTGFAGCSACHNERAPLDVKGNQFAKKHKSHQFVLLSEGRTWNQEDPHSKAHDVLTRALGKQMSAILKYDVTKAGQCLTCHAIDITPSAPLEKKQFETAEGITCNACHGLRKPWQQEHYAEKAKQIPWRTMTPEKKEGYGMRNLRDPVVRATLCTSCHVGSAAEDKVVTHEMYAAGHPPLPPFELGTFMESEPKHWGYPTDPALKFFQPDEFETYAGKDFVQAHPNWTWDLYRFHPADKEVYLARSVVAGAVASLRAEMRMIAADAGAAAKNPQADGVDYARFDCYACHHDLRVPSARQKRGYDGGKPGRPPLKAWVAALPGVVAEHAVGLAPLADTAQLFPAKWAAVRAAALSRPFGDPKALSAAAGDMAAWCDDFLAKSGADGKPLYTKAQAASLLAAVGAAATSDKWTADPEAAMHLTWAYLALKGAADGRPVAGAALDALGATIPVRVRRPPFSDDNGDPKPAGVEIGPRLKLFREYEADKFIGQFKALTGGK